MRCWKELERSLLRINIQVYYTHCKSIYREYTMIDFGGVIKADRRFDTCISPGRQFTLNIVNCASFTMTDGYLAF